MNTRRTASDPSAPSDLSTRRVHHGSPAWLLAGLGHRAGVLVLRAGRLAFLGDDGVVFDEPLREVRDLTFPWYWFGGGFRAEIAGTRRKVSLVRPQGAPAPTVRVLDLAGLDGLDLLTAAGSLYDAAAGRRRARTWRALLER